MTKINFNTPVPYSQRMSVIRAMRELGFSYKRIIQNGTYSLHRFYGRLPTIDGSSTVDILCDDLKTVDNFRTLLCGDIEIYFLFERKPKYENTR